MKILINSYVKVDENGDFRSGTVHFQSIVPNKEYIKFESALGVKVNLSKSGNPQCDTSIFHMHQHNGHAGTFTSRTVMEEYIKNSLDAFGLWDQSMQQQRTIWVHPNFTKGLL